MKRLFLSSFAVNFLVMALNLITGIIMARYLGPYGRGEFAAATRWQVLLTGLCTLGLPGAVIYLGKSYKERQRELFGAYMIVGMVTGIAGLALSQVLLLFIMGNQPKNLLHLAQLAMLGLPFAVITDGMIGTLQSLNKFKNVLILRLMSPFGLLGILVTLVLIGRLTPLWIIVSHILFWGIFTFLLTVYWVFKSLKPTLSRFGGNAKELMRNGVKIYAGSLTQVFGGTFDQVVLSLALSPYALGLYTVATSVGGILPSVIFGALNVFLLPKLMDVNGDARRREVEKIHSIFFSGTLILSICGAAALPFMLPLIYGSQFEPAVLMGIILLFGSPPRVCYTILLNYQTSEGRFYAVTITEILGLVSGLTIMLVLLPWFGATAAAIGIVAGTLLKWAYVAYQGRKLGLNLTNLFRFSFQDWKKLLRVRHSRNAAKVT